MPYPSRPLNERLLDKLNVRGPGECWIHYGKPGDKYSSLKIGGTNRKSIGAHVAAYQIWVGPVPDGMFVLHKCDVPRCCNPNHLFLGTAKDNMKDCQVKGRHWVVSGPDHYNYKHGKRVGESRRKKKEDV